jgi:hypothetical protein
MLDELGFDGPDELLPQAAKASAAHAAIDVSASLRLVRKTNETTSFVGSALHAHRVPGTRFGRRKDVCHANRRLRGINKAINILRATLKYS